MNNPQKIFCFGNEHFPGDERALEIANHLSYPGYEFVPMLRPEDLLQTKDDLWILDTVKGIDKVQLLNDINDLELTPSSTCHDLDLGFYLKLMEASGQVQKVNIIGIPFGEADIQAVICEIKKLLSNSSKESF